MATSRVAVTVQTYASLPEVGLQLGESAADTSLGNRFADSNGQRIFVARNSDVGSQTVQFTYTRRGQTVTQDTVTILAGKTKVFGPFPSEMGDHPSADEAPGDVYVTASHVGVLLSVVDIPGLTR